MRTHLLKTKSEIAMERLGRAVRQGRRARRRLFRFLLEGKGAAPRTIRRALLVACAAPLGWWVGLYLAGWIEKLAALMGGIPPESL